MKKDKSKKVANQKQILNLPLSSKINLQIIENIDNDLFKSLIFKLYIKSILLNKSLNLKTIYELQIFQLKKKFVIEAHFIENISETDCFIIDEQTDIEINILEESLENLKLENKDVLEFDKLAFLKKNCENFIENKSENIELIGLEDELSRLRSLINYNLLEVNRMETNLSTENIHKKFSYKGVIISGANGIGKTNFIKFMIQEHNKAITFFELNFRKLLLEKSKIEIEDHITNTFKYAKLLMPSIIIIEDIDKYFPKTEEDSLINFDDKRVKILNCLINEIENMFSLQNSIDSVKNQKMKNILVITTCSNSDKIDPDLIKPGNLDYMINLNPPNQPLRKRLFKHFSQFFMNNLTDQDFEILADKSHGFIPTDIIQIFKDCLIFMRVNNEITITKQILEKSLQEIKPINLKEIILDVPKVLWSEIGGNKENVMKIRQTIEWPLKNPDVFKKLGITSPNGILLYGPPGCSKTMIAKALATESGLNFFAVKGPELFSKYVGDTEKAIRDLFRKAKISSPSIIFFDEIDAMASERGSDSAVSDKVLCQLLNEMDGIEGREKVVIMGATNRPDILDKALIRPGRFDRLIYIPPPDFEARIEIFKINISKMHIEIEINIDELSNLTKGFSGAEINLICREAGMNAISRNLNDPKIEYEDFIYSIKNIKPIITQEMIDYFIGFAEKIKI